MQVTIENQTKQISDNSLTVIQLEQCTTKQDKYAKDLNEVTIRLTTSETNNVRLTEEIKSLTVVYQRCDTALSTLRCDNNKHLETIRVTQDRVNKDIGQATIILDDVTNLLKKFGDENDITCVHA